MIKNGAFNGQGQLNQELSSKTSAQSAAQKKRKDTAQIIQDTTAMEMKQEEPQEPVQEEGEDYLDRLLRGIK